MKYVQHEYEWKSYRSSLCIKCYILVWQVWLKVSYVPLLISSTSRSPQKIREAATMKWIRFTFNITDKPTHKTISPQLQLDLNVTQLELVIGYLDVLVRYQQVPCSSQPRGRSKMFSDDLHFPQTYDCWDTVKNAPSVSIHTRHSTQAHTGWTKFAH
jgi:hypothetical protein